MCFLYPECWRDARPDIKDERADCCSRCYFDFCSCMGILICLPCFCRIYNAYNQGNYEKCCLTCYGLPKQSRTEGEPQVQTMG